MLLYYITDRRQFSGSEQQQRRQLLLRIAEAARAGVDLIQLREKDLPTRELELLARDALRCVRDNSTTTKLLINSRTDLALAIGADGVHLTATDPHASDVRAVVAIHERHGERSAQRGVEPPFVPTRNSKLETRNFFIAVSCHSEADVRLAYSHGADVAVLAPIFEKHGTEVAPLGLDALRRATERNQPDTRVEAGDTRRDFAVLALGGITLSNAKECRAAGAAGIAVIRLFQTGDLNEVVRKLREQEKK